MSDARPERDLPAQLATLEAHLTELGAHIVRYWRPGADRARVERVLGSVGLSAPDEVVSWFGWHDGTTALPPGEPLFHKDESILISGWVHYTLDQALERRRSEWELLAEVGFPVIDRMQTWFPLLGLDTAAALLCVDCGRGVSQPPVYILDPGSGDVPGEEPRYASLSGFVAEVLRAFDEGRIEPDRHVRGAFGVGHGEVLGY